MRRACSANLRRPPSALPRQSAPCRWSTPPTWPSGCVGKLVPRSSGAVVIAAPYVETAIAFGAGCGLPEQWLRELLRFAPAADLQGLARERKRDRGWKPRLDRSYPEYCAALCADTLPRLSSKRARASVIAALQAARGRRVFQLEGKGIAQAASAVTGNQPASPPRRSSRPRTARK